jgi:acetylornithine deacetylase/succinyl-diaminopimelate desuccinylase-like protein
MIRLMSFEVVPAGESTTESWTYPPFSGHYDGEYIWGRGSEDDKSNLIAMLTAIDCLLQCDFRPHRTVVISVGFDEEGGAEQSYGARCLAEKLYERYGRDGIELIVGWAGRFPARVSADMTTVRRRYCGHRAPLRDGFRLACDRREGIR